MKTQHHFIVLAVLVIGMAFLFGTLYKLTGLDIISINSGGTSNITINPDTITAPPGNVTNITPPGGVPPGGGPGGGAIPTSNISIVPGQFILNMLVNTNLHKTVSVTNIGGNSMAILISQTNLTNLVILGNTSLTLNAGQTAILDLIFVAPNATGVYNGTINIGDRILPVSLNVVKEFILFDSNIIVLNKNYRVPKGTPLKTQVTMIPMGENVRLDITLNYIIKNTNGTGYTTSSETLLVTSRQSILRDFATGNLPIGNYTINLELVYPYGVAPSSAHFEVVKNVRDIYGTIIYWLVIAIVIVAILIIITIMMRTIRKLRNEMKESGGFQ